MRRAIAVVVAALVATPVVLVAGAPAAQAGPRQCPVYRQAWVGDGWGADRGSRNHTGIDLHGERGSPIRAVESGYVNRTKRQSNGALQIVLQGTRTGSKYYYGHMDTVLVKGGQRVKKGQVIGRMGDTGSPGTVHLHFEFWRSGGESAAVNPQRLITRVCRIRS